MLKDYSKLLNKKQKLNDKIANLQREKDFEVTKLGKKYESQIDLAMRDLSKTELLISVAKQFTKEH